MTRIAPLRGQLKSLREARQWIRWGTGYAGLALATLWLLAALFALDVTFQLNLLQRLLLIVVAIAVGVWAYRRFSVPFLITSEDDLDVALIVEREHQIDNDLVAALQFERPEASQWGSAQLETAVIDYVAELGAGLDVYQGLSRDHLVRRGTLLAITLAVSVAVAASFPGYVGTFLRRLFLSGSHYPTAVKIHRLSINRVQVLDPAVDELQPHSFKAPQGQSLRFDVLTSGQVPESGTLRIASGASQGRLVELIKLSLDQRLGRLRQADRILSDVLDDSEELLRESWRTDAMGAMGLDAPAIADQLRKASRSRDAIEDVRDRLAKVVQAWPGPAATTTVFSGELSRLVDAFQYKIHVGDAWTDPASVEMISLPIVELRLKVAPPDYARQVESAGTPISRQLSVLEGSSVDFSIEVMNPKRLEEAWVIVKTQPEPTRYSLSPKSDAPRFWRLDDPKSPFQLVQDELRFEVQVRDVDGMTLERPLQGFLRLRADRPPTGSQEVVHRVVLPTAKPKIEYRASDDFGISSLQLLVHVDRQANTQSAVTPDESNPAPVESSSVPIDLRSSQKIISPDQLPVSGSHSLDLSRFHLAKGDRVRVTLEVRDFRGTSEGQTYSSDPLVFEISDENGVYAAILEADQKSEKQLTDIIQRELGIGESP